MKSWRDFMRYLVLLAVVAFYVIAVLVVNRSHGFEFGG